MPLTPEHRNIARGGGGVGPPTPPPPRAMSRQQYDVVDVEKAIQCIN